MRRTKCKIELVAHLNGFIDCVVVRPALYFSYTRFQMWLARINKEKKIVYIASKKRQTDERCRQNTRQRRDERKNYKVCWCDIKSVFFFFRAFSTNRWRDARAINLFKVFHCGKCCGLLLLFYMHALIVLVKLSFGLFIVKFTRVCVAITTIVLFFR